MHILCFAPAVHAALCFTCCGAAQCRAAQCRAAQCRATRALVDTLPGVLLPGDVLPGDCILMLTDGVFICYNPINLIRQ